VSVDALIDEIRAAEGGAGPGAAAGEDDAELAVATRLRVMRSLEARARSRHQPEYDTFRKTGSLGDVDRC